MILKILIVCAFITIVVSLAQALFFLIKDEPSLDNKRTVKALGRRVAFTIALLIFLVIASKMGWITPHSLFPRP